jgi:capsular exopolysaccharide synthesis family protein
MDDTVWLGDYLQVLRRRKWLILLVTALGTGLAFLIADRQTPIYESTSRVLATNVVLQTQAAEPPNLETEQSLVTSEAVIRCAQLVLAEPEFAEAPSLVTPDMDVVCADDELAGVALDRSLVEQLEVSSVASSSIITISATDPEPIRAEGVAQAFALSYIHAKTEQARDLLDQLRAPLLEQQASLTEQIASVNQQIADLLSKEARDASEGKEPSAADNQLFLSLQSQLNNLQLQLQNASTQLQALDESKVNPPQLILPAQLPKDPVSPQVLLYVAAGFLVGLAVGVILAFVRDRMDDRLRGRSDLEDAAEAPVLAAVPHIQGWRRKGNPLLIAREDPTGVASEAYRTLRTGVAHLSSRTPMRTIMVASPTAGEGKSTTVANLAYVLAEGGRHVIVVSADLRKPRLHRFFDVPNESGLSSILTGEDELWDVLQDPGVKNLRVLASGATPPRPADLLDSRAMVDVLASLKGISDYVLIDSVPVLLGPDALVLAPHVDGIVLVADAAMTTRTAIADARLRLEQAGGRIIASVLNNFDPRKLSSYRYYGYYGSYGYTERDGKGAGAPAQNGQRTGVPEPVQPPVPAAGE